jgi:hypothetical protein
MNPTTVQNEVLVILNSSFAQRNWCVPEDDVSASLSSEEKLEEACVNGLFQDLIPEAFAAKTNNKIFLWQVHVGVSCVQLELGELPAALEKKFSIDPNNFIPSLLLN